MAVDGDGRIIIIMFTFLISSIFILSSGCYPNPTTTDTLVQGKPLRDWECLVSANNTFTLGFFSQVGISSDKRYLGIWYTKASPAKVWVANRNYPIPDTSGNLIIDNAWNLRISYKGGRRSISVSNDHNNQTGISNTSAVLQENGNLVLREDMGDGTIRVLWQSFDYPTDTLLPGMKLGINLRTGHEWSLTSWRSIRDPASGHFSLGADFRNDSQLVALWRGKIYWSSGIWRNGSSSFDNLPAFTLMVARSGFQYVWNNKEERYFSFYAEEGVPFPRLVLQPSGVLNLGPNTLFFCEPNIPRPGCVMPDLPECRKPASQLFEYSDGGYDVSGEFKLHGDMTVEDCRFRCWYNCSCLAFSTEPVSDTGCILWSTIQPRKYPVGQSLKLYVLLERDKGNISLILTTIIFSIQQ